MIFRLRNPLGLRIPAPRMLVNDFFWDAFPLWHVKRRQRLTLVTPGSVPLVRRSHGYPDFLPVLWDRAAVASSRFTLPVS